MISYMITKKLIDLYIEIYNLNLDFHMGMERASKVRKRRNIGVNVTALRLRPDDPPTDDRVSELPF